MSGEKLTWEPGLGEIERIYPARTPLPDGYRVIWHEGSEFYYWITEDGRLESAPTWNHWACWRGAWAHHRAALQALGGSDEQAE